MSTALPLVQRTRFPQLSGYGRHAGAHVGPIPPFRPSYAIYPGDRIEVEVVQPDGGRALVVGRLNAVPESAGGARYGFGCATRASRRCLSSCGTRHGSGDAVAIKQTSSIGRIPRPVEGFRPPWVDPSGHGEGNPVSEHVVASMPANMIAFTG
jgi:hypothetical protein